MCMLYASYKQQINLSTACRLGSAGGLLVCLVLKAVYLLMSQLLGDSLDRLEVTWADMDNAA